MKKREEKRKYREGLKLKTSIIHDANTDLKAEISSLKETVRVEAEANDPLEAKIKEREEQMLQV